MVHGYDALMLMIAHCSSLWLLFVTSSGSYRLVLALISRFCYSLWLTFVYCDSFLFSFAQSVACSVLK